MSKLIRAGLAGVLVLAACGGGGPATPKLSKIENSDGSSQLRSYSADKLTEVKVLDKDGKVVITRTYQYTDDRITSMSHKEGDYDPFVTTFTYTDKRLTSKTESSKFQYDLGGLKYDVTGKVTTTYTYASGRLSKEDRSTVVTMKETVSGTTYESKSSSTTDYTYTADGSLERRTVTRKTKENDQDVTKIATDEFSYDSAKKLVSVTTTEDSTTSMVSFTYDTSGRVAKISSGEDSVTYEYNTESKLSRAITKSGSTTTTTTYTYEVGNVIGFVPTVGTAFDLAGMFIPMTNQIVPYDWMVM